MARWALFVSLILLTLISGASGRCPSRAGELQSDENVTVTYEDGIGYTFSNKNSNGGCYGPRGLIIVPEDGVPPEAYASIARGAASRPGYGSIIVDEPSAFLVLKVLKVKTPQVDNFYWSLVGHGKGGEVAVELVDTIAPKVKSVVLLGSSLPKDIDLRLANVLVVLVNFGLDRTVSQDSITDSFSRMPGDATVLSLPELNHFDFLDVLDPDASSKWEPGELSASSNATISARAQIISLMLFSLSYGAWPIATTKALSYGDNEILTPGHNDSKPYPGDILVKYTEMPIPDTILRPKRVWSIFTPTKVKGGFVYYAGGGVDYRAYWPLAFEIAARGYLVVIPQQPSRNALMSVTDATTIIDSGLEIFTGVSKSKWAIGGHSLGSAGASFYAATYGDKIFAGVLHSGIFALNMSTNQLPMAMIYGTLDNLFGGYEAIKTMALPYANLATTKFVVIPHGNHGQVGDYGNQLCDQVATISLEYQHKRTAEETTNFLDSHIGDY